MSLCKLCNVYECGLNGLVCEDCLKKSKYQAKASLLLEGAEQYNWGAVLLSPSSIIIPSSDVKIEDTQVVGTWGKMADGKIWVNVETPLQALQDKAVLSMLELMEKRKKSQELIPISRHAPAPAKVKPGRASPPASSTPDPSITAFNDLRAKIMRLGGR